MYSGQGAGINPYERKAFDSFFFLSTTNCKWPGILYLKPAAYPDRSLKLNRYSEFRLLDSDCPRQKNFRPITRLGDFRFNGIE